MEKHNKNKKYSDIFKESYLLKWKKVLDECDPRHSGIKIKNNKDNLYPLKNELKNVHSFGI